MTHHHDISVTTDLVSQQVDRVGRGVTTRMLDYLEECGRHRDAVDAALGVLDDKEINACEMLRRVHATLLAHKILCAEIRKENEIFWSDA